MGASTWTPTASASELLLLEVLSMGGPIVRTGATPEFSQGWERIFGKKKKAAPAPAKKSTKSAKKAKK